MIGKKEEMIIEFYFKDKKFVHVSCSSGRFYNGIILEINSKKQFLILKDQKLGEVPIMFEEINFIEPFKEEEDK